MKKTLSLLLITAVLCSLCGCTRTSDDSYSFYYLREEFTYGSPDSVIVSEQRDISAHREELKYLLGLYFAGPLEDTMKSPFPKGIRLIDATIDGDTITILLSDEFSSLKDIHLTLAGACIASTCFDLTDASTVVICAGEPGSKPLVSLTRDSLTLLDTSTSNAESIPGEAE